MAPRKKIKKRIIPTGPCPFCKNGVDPDYRDYKNILGFFTARSAITPKKYSGVCSKHQRLLSREAKRARNLGLLPFLPHA